jgi:hypothetical protein
MEKKLLDIENAQKFYDKICVNFDHIYLVLDSPKDIPSLDLLMNGNHNSFVSSIKYKSKNRSYYQSFISDPASSIRRWLKEWDVEPGGMAVQAVEEEFNSLSKTPIINRS